MALKRFVATAPGRLDVMGGIADYSGSLVLQLPLSLACRVEAESRSDRVLTLISHETFSAPLSEFEDLDYPSARAFFGGSWAAYVAGAVVVLKQELGVWLPEGVTLRIESQVPQGKGVASSAALEVASMRALTGLFSIALAARDLALLCQKIENQVVGAPCGVMDQMTAACGERGKLLAMMCRPAEVQGLVEIPSHVGFWGIDSGVRHRVSGAEYGAVRIGAEMGLSMLQRRFRVRYLTEIDPSDVDPSDLPESMTGEEFLAEHGATAGVEPARVYPVRAATLHPIFEHPRVERFRELIEKADRSALRKMGALMYESHASYSACGLGSEATDRLVDMARAAGTGIHGAKITGGGCGGTVAVLADRSVEEEVLEIARAFGQAAVFK
jgi:L-arabinokinase